MDLSQPIRTVIPSLDGPVLAVLVRTSQALTGRRVHQLAGTGSEPGVRKVLRRLSETGLVTAVEAGGSTLYTLNRQHVAAPVVEQLVNLRQFMIDRLREEFRQWRLAPVHASLFGSAARGDGGPASDIDILLIHDQDPAYPPALWVDQVSDLAELVYRWTGNHAQMYELGLEQLDEHIVAGEEIVQEWVRDAITLAGLDFRQLRTARRSPR
ncbi:putative nucleotidyltransferase [Kribbella sp. VKM Ac-2527]|uniref:Putative nucleotidyltransferase n=1 Tax=Kribbella caucasensis TaxID=2512215 RepID=A0A4R6KFG1_9ACTN|nr:nucleotidyltransferase domain-containing protein [Kribbella sp. VKM Ac-2527]TDO49399.1 putative nucleotidyltransferase [Kribbella sp. VKM Ac-2527]